MIDLNTYLSKEESESLGPEFRQFLKGLSDLLDSSIDDLLREMEQRKRLYADWSNNSAMLRLLNSAKYKPPCAYMPCPETAMGSFCPGWEKNWALEATRIFGLDEDSFSLNKLRRKLLEEYGIFLRGADYQDGMLNPVFLVHGTETAAREAMFSFNKDLLDSKQEKFLFPDYLPTNDDELQFWITDYSILSSDGGNSYPLTEWNSVKFERDQSNDFQLEEFAEVLYPEEYVRWKTSLWSGNQKVKLFTELIAQQFPRTCNTLSQKLIREILLH